MRMDVISSRQSHREGPHISAAVDRSVWTTTQSSIASLPHPGLERLLSRTRLQAPPGPFSYGSFRSVITLVGDVTSAIKMVTQ